MAARKPIRLVLGGLADGRLDRLEIVAVGEDQIDNRQPDFPPELNRRRLRLLARRLFEVRLKMEIKIRAKIEPLRYIGFDLSAGNVLRRTRALTRPSKLSRPIFLVGTVRSGTTLLARSLGSHPDFYYARFELSQEWSSAGGVEIACPETSDAHCPERLVTHTTPVG